jgi:hypothetical protein
VRTAVFIFLLPAFLGGCGAEEKPSACPGTCLALTEVFTFTDSDYRFHVTGKVKNFSPDNAKAIMVTADFFSDSDHQFPVSSGSQSLPPIPGEEGFRTFDIWSPTVKLLPGTGGYPVVFFEAQASGVPGGNEPIPESDLFMEKPNLYADVYGRYHVQVKIRNAGQTAVEMVYLTVSFFRDEAQTDLIGRLRKGFGRFLGTPPPKKENETPGSPVYLLDFWHPEITQAKYPFISTCIGTETECRYYRVDVSE